MHLLCASSAHSHVSLFSGAGGHDIGLEKAGFTTLACVEKDASALRTLRTNRESLGLDTEYFEDVTAISGEDLLTAAGLGVGELELLSGGPPCQPFSTAGARQSVLDARGNLFGRYLELVGEIQPRFFVLENVRGLLSAALRHRPLDQRGADHPELEPEERLGSLLNDAILPALQESLGYQVTFGLVNAADYGVPQVRQRVLFIGSRDHELGSGPGAGQPIEWLMPPTRSQDVLSGLPGRETLREALTQPLNESGGCLSYSSERRKIFERVPAGANWRYLRDNFGDEYTRTVMGGAYGSGGGKVGFWRRLSWDKPSPTLPTSPIQKSTGLCHPDETRPLSVSEYARIQQFPDTHEFTGTVASKYRQIGNAVPVGLAEAVGQAVMNVATGTAGSVHSSAPAQRRLLEPASVGS